jgi:hypothetical protein
MNDRVGTKTIPTTLAGLTFPIGDSRDSRSLVLALPDLTLRWPAIPPYTTQSLRIGITATNANNDTAPYILVLSPEGIVVSQNVLPFHTETGRTALDHDPEGNLHLIWSVLRGTGKTSLIYATNKYVRKGE